MLTVLHIQGMTCGGCVRSVERALSKVDGVSSVQVELSSGRVQVEGQANEQKIREAILNAGYELIP